MINGYFKKVDLSDCCREPFNFRIDIEYFSQGWGEGYKKYWLPDINLGHPYCEFWLRVRVKDSL